MISPEVLRIFPHFAGMSSDCLSAIAMLSNERTFFSGEKIFCENNTARHLILIREGEINIIYQLGDGSEVVADTLGVGDTLAWSALLEPHKLTATGEANKDGVLIEIDGEGLRRICEDDTQYGYTILKEIAKTLRNRLSAMRVQIAAQTNERVLATVN